MRILIQPTIAMLLTLTAVADDIHTIAESGQAHLPAADFVVKIEKNTLSVYDTEQWDEPIAKAATSLRAADQKNIIRQETLNLMLEVAAHYHHKDWMFVLIQDEYYMPLSAGLYYKAYIKLFTPKDVTAVVKP
jgi:hypothetical protein